MYKLKFYEKHWHGQMSALEGQDLTKEQVLQIRRYIQMAAAYGGGPAGTPEQATCKQAGPFVQGEHADSGWILVEFWSDAERARAAAQVICAACKLSAEGLPA